MSPHQPRLVLVALVLLLAAGRARAGEAWYLLMFGAQRVPNNPNYSHTWATFVRACWAGDGPGPAAPRLEAHTISWMPRTMVVRTLALRPECGGNYDVHATVRWCLGNDMRVSLWGAYQIDPELYDRALRRAAELGSGQVLYKANDVGYRSDCVTNCIHAVSTIAEGPRVRVASPGWGETASYVVLRELTPWVIQPGCPHPWVGSALGLDQYPLLYRDWENPRSGAIRGPVVRLFGGERDLAPSYGPPGR